MGKTKKSGAGRVVVCVLFGGVSRQENSVSSARTVGFYLLVMMAINV